MKPEPWNNVADAFAHAAELPGDARAAFLQELRGKNQALFAQVESMLWQTDAGSIDSVSAPWIETEVLAPPSPDQGFSFLGPAQGPDELGRLGGYRIVGVLGSGGMGVVFKAEDPLLRRWVALKVMKSGLGGGDVGRQRFVREARAAAAVKHDHIVTIYQVGEERGVPFLAMDFLQGESLAKWLKRGQALKLGQILRLTREIAQGLAAAHARGLVHRDIKPGNIWLEAPRGRVKLLDFGLARPLTDENPLTQQGDVLGTPAYMSPEQAQGAAVDNRSDLFSLGSVVYELCTGRRPFQGKGLVEIAKALADHEPPHLHEVCADLPPDFAALVMKLLAKNPSQRPVSAQAVVDSVHSVERAVAALRSSDPMLMLAAAAAAPLSAPTPPPAAAPPPTPVGSQSQPLAHPPDKPAQATTRGKNVWRWALVAGAGLALGILIANVLERRNPPEQPPTPVDPSKKPMGLAALDASQIPAELRWDGQPADVVAVLRETRKEDAAEITALAISPTGKWLASGGQDGAIWLWNLEGAAPAVHAAIDRFKEPITSLAFAPDSKTLAVVSADGMLRVWDLAPAQPVDVFFQKIVKGVPKKGWSAQVVFAPDGVLATRVGKGVVRWKFQGAAVTELPAFGPVVALGPLAFMADGRLALGESRGVIEFWNVAGAEPAKEKMTIAWPTSVVLLNIAPAPDGKILAAAARADNAIRLWDISGPEPRSLAALQGLTIASKPNAALVQWAPGGEFLAARDAEGKLICWDGIKHQQTVVWRIPGKNPTLAIAPDNQHLLAGTDDGKIVILRLATRHTSTRTSD